MANIGKWADAPVACRAPSAIGPVADGRVSYFDRARLLQRPALAVGNGIKRPVDNRAAPDAATSSSGHRKKGASHSVAPVVEGDEVPGIVTNTDIASRGLARAIEI